MKHLDAAAHTRGTSRYVDDVPPPEGMLHAAVFGSPKAHGTLRSVTIEAARSSAGVAAVLLAKDIPGQNQIGPVIPDEPLLAEDAVHFVGQPIAVVLAETPQQARHAAHLIEVEIEDLPVITDPKEAFAAGEIIGKARTVSIGDVDAAWEECDLILEGECDIGGQEHVYLETQRSRAEPLENGHIRISSSTQSPYAAQRMTAQVLGLAHHAIEVDVKRLGGGFGGKEDQATPWAVMAALGVHHTGRAVELVLRREEDLPVTGKRHPYRSDWKIGLKNSGEVVAFEAWNYQNSGAAADLSPPVLARTLFHATNAYRIPNARIFGACCRTNLPPNTAFRGFGGPQGMFVIESALARASEVLSIPREQLQRKNLLCDGDRFPYGQVVREGRAERTWDEAAELFDLNGWKERIAAHNEEHRATKKGFAAMPICFGISFTTTFLNQAGALVHIYTDGSVAVSTGGVEMGQGVSTNMATVVARTFGIDAGRVKVESTNTTRVANMSASAASATTLLNGNATLLACQKILKDLKRLAAAQLGLPLSDPLALVDERLFNNGQDTGWTWERLVKTAYFERVPLSAHAHFATPNVWYDEEKEEGRPFAYHVFGTAFLEVTLDALRGTYTIDTVKVLHDLGRAMNQTIDLGQVEGGLAQGLGWMTLEELRWSDEGRCLSGALATYKVPDVDFMPDDLEVRFLENAGNPLGPFHSKAVGEPPLMYGIGVFFALRDAMRAVRADDSYAFASPLTPERVLMELYRERVGELTSQPATECSDGPVAVLMK